MTTQTGNSPAPVLSGDPATVLIRGPNWIGDHIMAFPAYHLLRKAFSHSRLVFAGKPSVLAVPDAGLFDDKIPASFTSMLESRASLAVSFAASLRVAFQLWRTGIPKRIGASEPLAWLLYHQGIVWRGRDEGVHKSELYLRLARLAAKGTRIDNSPSELDFSEVLPPMNFPPRPFIAVAPGASISLRQYPHLPELIRHVRRRFPALDIVVVGSTKEDPWRSKIDWGDGQIHDWIGKTTVSQLIETFRHCRAAITMDSGPAHIAATLAQVPTVVLFGPGDPRYVLPLGPHVFPVRRTDLACSPCESAKCHGRYGYQSCLTELSPEACLPMLDKALTPPAERPTR